MATQRPASGDDAALDALCDGILAGNQRAAARAMRLVDDRDPAAFDLLRRLHGHTGNARIIGITGNPGSGKSTLVDKLIGLYRARDLRVGIVAVDPSSPFTGGAILGDRIRMSDHATDDGVFIRSLATRGHLGGLSRSTHDVVSILDAMGYDVVIIETVGVGQDEVEVVKLAQTSVVIVVPGMGDDIQAIKAGILEIADLLVVNKADREGADLAVRDLRAMQMLASVPADSHPPILRTVAVTGEGVEELAAAIDAHGERGDAEGERLHRARRREAHVLETLVLDRLLDRLGHVRGDEAEADVLLDRLIARETDPYSEAERILEELLGADD